MVLRRESEQAGGKGKTGADAITTPRVGLGGTQELALVRDLEQGQVKTQVLTSWLLVQEQGQIRMQVLAAWLLLQKQGQVKMQVLAPWLFLQ